MNDFYGKLPDGGAGHVNIFQFDADPVLAARQHCDAHVIKMILETAQLLSTSWHMLCNPAYRVLDSPDSDEFAALFQVHVEAFPARGEAASFRRIADGPLYSGETAILLLGQRIYRATHVNHPCAVWAREIGGNYKWLWSLGLALCAEYTYRFDKTHKTEGVIWTLEAVPPPLLDTTGTWNWVPPCMAEAHKVLDEEGYYDTPKSYANYCLTSKSHILKWTRRSAPEWAQSS